MTRQPGAPVRTGSEPSGQRADPLRRPDVLPRAVGLVLLLLLGPAACERAPADAPGPAPGSGPATAPSPPAVFGGSTVTVRRCTFTDNWNGADDQGRGNRYVDTIFWMNDRAGGIAPGARYELDVVDGSGVSGCRLHGITDDLRGTIDVAKNVVGAPDPRFDADFRPTAAGYEGVGYRPLETGP